MSRLLYHLRMPRISLGIILLPMVEVLDDSCEQRLGRFGAAVVGRAGESVEGEGQG